MSGGATLGLPFVLWNSACVPTATTVANTGTGLSLGCLAGDVTANGAIVWIRGEPGSVVSVHYGKDPSLSEFVTTNPVPVDGASDYTVKFVIERLEAGTVYYYRGAVAGKKPGPISRFMTAPLPEQLAKVTFCFSADTRESYRPFLIMDSIRAQQPNFFLHLGDTIYADREGRARMLPEFWRKYRTNRKDAPSQRLFSETSLYVVWDDHEVGDNYDFAHPLAPMGRKAFFDYWPVRRDLDEPDRIYRSFRWGKGMELFILDTRQYRDPSGGTMLGKKQKEWLVDALSSSDAIFKFIGTSVPFSGKGRDKWGGFPGERDEILKFIANKKISGIVFISADLHYAAVSRVSGGLGLKEVTVGPLAAQVNWAATGRSKRFEFFSNESFNYGHVTVDPGPPPYALVEILDQDNKSLYKTRFEVG